MEIVNFKDTEFKDIPFQDNPAFDKHECILIFKNIDKNGASITVSHIVPTENPYKEETIHRKANFWNIEDAIFYAEKFIDNKKYGVH
jgi:hypothetical protein